MSKFESVAIPFVTIGNKQFLRMSDVYRLDLFDFVKRFEHCFDRDDPACIGLVGYFYYPEGKPEPMKT